MQSTGENHTHYLNEDLEVDVMWTKPAYEDVRLGFEITMYFKTR